jgi:hypothetical protein
MGTVSPGKVPDCSHAREVLRWAPPVVITTIAKNTRESVRVALDHYQGHDLVDVRIVTPLTTETGTLVPTKKGISLRLDQLPNLIKALQDAEAEARRRGLLKEAV